LKPAGSKSSIIIALGAAIVLCLGAGEACRPRSRPVPPLPQRPGATRPVSVPPSAAPPASGFVIQVGVFASENNALRLAEALKAEGLDVRAVRQATGMVKVQIGDFPTRAEAEEEGRMLLKSGRISEFFVPAVSAPRAAPPGEGREASLRRGLAETARSFIDYPYAWGGTSAREGFDCSGLAMTVYRLNGLELSRSLSDQYAGGIEISREDVADGDLVFFATRGGRRVSHVGIYVGGGMFIHAPGQGKAIRCDSLVSRYFAERFIGARRYF
jgi:hypothetical protein